MSTLNRTHTEVVKRRKTTPLSDFERGMVIAYRDCDLTKQEICKRVERSYSCVQQFIKRYEESPPPMAKRKSKSKLKDRFTTRIKLSLKRNPSAPLEYHLNQIRIEGFDISLNALSAQLKKMGLWQYM